MRTAQERVDALHARSRALRRRRQQIGATYLGAACALLLVCLTGLVLKLDHVHTGVSPGMFTGATLLFESAGGYVLVAVIAFAVGAVVTAFLVRRRQAGAFREERSQITKPKGEGGQIE